MNFFYFIIRRALLNIAWMAFVIFAYYAVESMIHKWRIITLPEWRIIFAALLTIFFMLIVQSILYLLAALFARANETIYESSCVFFSFPLAIAAIAIYYLIHYAVEGVKLQAYFWLPYSLGALALLSFLLDFYLEYGFSLIKSFVVLLALMFWPAIAK